MRLSKVRRAQSLRQKIQLLLMRLGDYTPTDFNFAMLYRPEFFGDAFGRLQVELARGESDWTLAERELFCAFVSKTNGCRF
jgi:hypothetical protein